MRHLRQLANPEHARIAEWFFKTGPGEYGEGDRFLGIRVPVLRKVVPAAAELPLPQVQKLLGSPWHEARLLALLILVRQYAMGNDTTRAAIYRLYLASTARINNWDLVDSSAPQIVGRHLHGRGRTTLARLARSRSLWERRIAMLATFWSIGRNDHDDAIAIATMLLGDREDLIHKAVGWMLREVSKRDRARLIAFLDAHAATMPRTMLRYAIEKLPATRRAAFLRRKKTAGERRVRGTRAVFTAV